MGIFSHDEWTMSVYDMECINKYEEIEKLVSNFRTCISKDFDYDSCWESSCTSCMRSLVKELVYIIDDKD